MLHSILVIGTFGRYALYTEQQEDAAFEQDIGLDDDVEECIFWDEVGWGDECRVS